MTLLIVTPMHNEADNVSGVVSNLRAQRFQDFDWVAVDDGSTDGTAERLAEVDTEKLAMVVSRTNDGGLIGGSAFSAWRFGVAKALPRRPYSHVMKLDADVRLAPDYLERVMELARGGVGIAGGVSRVGGHERAEIPRDGCGQDVHGAGVPSYRVDADGHWLRHPGRGRGKPGGSGNAGGTGAHFELARYTGASEGLTHGRYRNGRGCRWTGYWFPYFLIHCARYLVRRPYVDGFARDAVGLLPCGQWARTRRI